MSKMIYSILYEETSVTNIQILKYMPNNVFQFLKDYLCFKFWVYELFIKIFLTKIDATKKFLMPAKMTWISQEKDILNAILENNAIWRVYSITASSQLKPRVRSLFFRLVQACHIGPLVADSAVRYTILSYCETHLYHRHYSLLTKVPSLE